jgi:predicted aminopeptidase
MRSVAGVGTILSLAVLAGCGGADAWSWNYAMGALGGELEYLGRAVPIEHGLEDPNLTQDQKDRLAFVIKARDYAEQVVGLDVGESFRTFVNLGGEGLAWNLSVSPKDAIQAYTWNIPLVGSLPYLGFFKYDEALAERDRLVAEGYDTLLYELDAFSTLGVMPDPVASTLLDRPLSSLADTVFHELLHNTIWNGSQTVFNESLATFVGRSASADFLAFEFGADSDLLIEAQNRHHDADRVNEFLKEMETEVLALYAESVSLEEKMTRREGIFEAARQRFKSEVQPTLREPNGYDAYGTLNYNNAFLLVNVRYNNNLHVFAQVHESTGESWSESLGIFRQAAGSSDPYAFLQNYLENRLAIAN